MSDLPWSREEFEAQLRQQGSAYHIHHPFNVLLNSGNANRDQIRGWVANRYLLSDQHSHQGCRDSVQLP